MHSNVQCSSESASGESNPKVLYTSFDTVIYDLGCLTMKDFRRKRGIAFDFLSLPLCPPLCFNFDFFLYILVMYTVKSKVMDVRVYSLTCLWWKQVAQSHEQQAREVLYNNSIIHTNEVSSLFLNSLQLRPSHFFCTQSVPIIASLHVLSSSR